jgi:hypothetical protein
MKRFYVINYEPDGIGSPYYLGGNYDPEEWEFDIDDPNPLDIKVNREHALSVTDPEIKNIDFDFYTPDPTIVSKEFLALCEKQEVAFKAITLDISLAKRKNQGKKYSIFIPATHIALLDIENSVADIEKILETGENKINPIFPPNFVYAKIEKFATKEIQTPPLFQCIEIRQLVCTEEFKAEALSRNLKGLKFVPIDEQFQFDPWA